MVKLYKHQEEALLFLRQNGYCGYIALPPGLGKTLIAAYAIKELNPKKALIIAPKSAKDIWEKELKLLNIPPDTYTFINYEKFLRLYGNDKNKLPYTDFLIIDEAHRIKNIKAKTTRLLMNYGKLKIPKILLSGTPFKELIDLYTQFFVLDPKILGRWKDFINKYFLKTQNPFGGIQYIPLNSSEKEILEKLSPYFFRKDRSDFKDLEKIEVQKYFPTPPEFSWENFKKSVIDEIYQETEDEFLDEETFLELFIEKIKGKFIQYYRQAQLANKEKHLFIKEFLEDNPDTIVFTHFVDEAKLIAQKIDSYLITGQTSDKERNTALQKQDKPIIMTPAFKESVNLDKYGTLIFATLPSSPIQMQQVAGRIDRISQKRKAITYIYLLDEYNKRMYDILNQRKKLNDLFIEIIKEAKQKQNFKLFFKKENLKEKNKEKTGTITIKK